MAEAAAHAFVLPASVDPYGTFCLDVGRRFDLGLTQPVRMDEIAEVLRARLR